MHTWGISGPQFLVFYLALLGVTVLVVVLARRRALAGPHDATATPTRLDPYEAAYLNGGSGLVATTAVSNLIRDGSLANWSRRRRQVELVTRAAPPAGAHPIEWAAYQQVAAHPNRPLKAVPAALEHAPAMAAVRERLRLGGLVPTPEQRAS